jgi:hypothetical protein
LYIGGNNMAKTFKVSIKANEEVNAGNTDEALKIAFKQILRDLGVANINDEVLSAMEERFVYNVTGKKD